MKLPPEVEFYKDIRLLVYRPRGLIDEAAINRSSVLSKRSKLQRKNRSIDSPIPRKPTKLSSTSDTSLRFLFIGVSPMQVVRR